MPRGRRPDPDALKELKGNPGKRPLHGDATAGARAKLVEPAIEPPDYLKHEREIALFKTIVADYQQRRIARSSDIHAYARYAYYMHRWIAAKDGLGDNPTAFYKIESNHGTRLAPHPLSRIMFETERQLIALEDRLGLNPAARQNIVRGLAAMPAALVGDLFSGEPDDPDAKIPDASDVSAPAAEDFDPLGCVAPPPVKH